MTESDTIAKLEAALAAANVRADAANVRADANGKALAAAKKAADAAKKALAVSDGSYYGKMDSLWIAKQEEFKDGESAVWSLRKDADDQVTQFYQSELKKKKKGEFPELAMFPGTNGEDYSLAHLVPNDRSCSLFWGRALALVSGIGNQKTDNSLASASLRHLIEGCRVTGVTGSKGSSIGIKDTHWNYLKLPGSHYKHFDHMVEEKCLIITPIWDQETKWAPGKAYELLVVAATTDTYQWMGLQGLPEKEEWVHKASEDDICKATNFLSLMVKALADQLTSDSSADFFKQAELVVPGGIHAGLLDPRGDGNSQRDSTVPSSAQNSSANDQPKLEDFKKKLHALLAVQKELKQKGTVAVPELKNGGDDGETIFLKINLEKYFESSANHIPDPFLVSLKAAVNWSALQEEKLLPACKCPPPVIEDDSVCSISSIEEITFKQTYADDDCSVLSEQSVSPIMVTPDTSPASKAKL